MATEVPKSCFPYNLQLLLKRKEGDRDPRKTRPVLPTHLISKCTWVLYNLTYPWLIPLLVFLWGEWEIACILSITFFCIPSMWYMGNINFSLIVTPFKTKLRTFWPKPSGYCVLSPISVEGVTVISKCESHLGSFLRPTSDASWALVLPLMTPQVKPAHSPCRQPRSGPHYPSPSPHQEYFTLFCLQDLPAPSLSLPSSWRLPLLCCHSLCRGGCLPPPPPPLERKPFLKAQL